MADRKPFSRPRRGFSPRRARAPGPRDDPTPGWNGCSTARWDGDTLVVETAGFRDGLWIDTGGSPMSDVAKMTERIRRPNYGTLELAITIDDPKTYTRPFTVNLTQNLKVDTELIDEFCLENEKSYEHAALARQVARAVNILPGRTMLRPGIPAHREFPRQTATLGPVFVRNVTFRPSVELAVGEVTTLFAVHLDGLYTIGNAGRQSGWMPYLGAGPNLSFSHRGFEGEEDGQRFDFGEFNFDGGLNFIAGARNPRGVFIEMKATAYGVANVRLLGGFSF